MDSGTFICNEHNDGDNDQILMYSHRRRFVFTDSHTGPINMCVEIWFEVMSGAIMSKDRFKLVQICLKTTVRCSYELRNYFPLLWHLSSSYSYWQSRDPILMSLNASDRTKSTGVLCKMHSEIKMNPIWGISDFPFYYCPSVQDSIVEGTIM